MGGVLRGLQRVTNGGGGGVANHGGTVTMTNSTISGNSLHAYCFNGCSYVDGGGVANFGGTVTMTNSTIAGNYAFLIRGGGIFNFGTLTVPDSTVTGNNAAISTAM